MSHTPTPDTHPPSPTYAPELPHTHLMGRYGSPDKGPIMLCFGGIHGNEPAGTLALRKVLAHLQQTQPQMAGEFLAIVGNPSALAENQRYLNYDLNRIWTRERIAALEAGEATEDPELQHQRDLYKLLHQTFARSHTPVYALDLHTSSSPSTPFGVVGQTLSSQSFALHFPIPLIFNIERHLHGALLEYVSRLGHITLGFEAGQHEDPASVTLHEAMIWFALQTTGLLPPQALPESHLQRERLIEASHGVPPAFKVFYRHAITPQDEFRMKPGYKNFDRLAHQEEFASDKNGPIRAPKLSHILLPLYQGKGNDGFFLANAPNPRWLKLSLALRKMTRWRSLRKP